MPPVKRALAKKKPLAKPITIIDTRTVPLAELKMYHKNPRVGNVDAIVESLQENGQFKPIVVNVGSKTKRKNEILGGNHTYMAAKKAGWSEIVVSFVDVDDAHATKIVLSDNKTADLGTYDERIIAELFESLPDITGTGYSDEEMERLLAGAEEAAVSTLTGLEEEELEREHNGGDGSLDDFGADDTDDGGGYDDEDDGEVDTQRIEKQSEELPGLVQLRDTLDENDPKLYVGRWGIPRLRSDMLMRPEEVPDNLDSWAGSACKDWPDPDQWWLYNWGVDSTSGMKDVSKVIVSFYCWDDYFDNWYWSPKKYVTKLLNSGIKYMVSPNYSMWDGQSATLNLWALYRARYVARYAQEAGIKIIPDIIFPGDDLKMLREIILPTLPKKLPMFAMQAQQGNAELADLDDKGETGKLARESWAVTQEIIDTIQPEAILLYASDAGKRAYDKTIQYDGKLIYVETRLKKLAEKAKQREKKKTI